jgi:hypothetical protein
VLNVPVSKIVLNNPCVFPLDLPRGSCKPSFFFLTLHVD